MHEEGNERDSTDIKLSTHSEPLVSGGETTRGVGRGEARESNSVPVINPRRACAARATVAVLCVCACFRGSHLRLAQLSDKLDILAVSVSCSLVFKYGVFRIMAFVSKIAIVFPYLRVHGSRPLLYAK